MGGFRPLSDLRLGDPFRQPRCRFAPTTGSLQSTALGVLFPVMAVGIIIPAAAGMSRRESRRPIRRSKQRLQSYFLSIMFHFLHFC